jgi:hypothetical protein
MKSGGVASRSASWASFAGAIGAVLLPKCPACFAAYGSGLTALGLGPAAPSPLVEPLLVAAVLVSFGVVQALSFRRGDAVTPLILAAGLAFVLAGRFALDLPAVTAFGGVLMLGAALANSALCRRSCARTRAAGAKAVRA